MYPVGCVNSISTILTLVCHIGSIHGMRKPPEGWRLPKEDRSALQCVSGDPLLRLEGDIHERLKVIEAKEIPLRHSPDSSLNGREKVTE